MLEDKFLVWKFKHGNKDSFCRIYEKYRDDLLRLAISLLNEVSAAEDVVHDVFTSFIHNSAQFRLTGSLKGYLATCVANRARNINRKYQRQQTIIPDRAGPAPGDCESPERWITCSEDLSHLVTALAQLPDNQRETIILHVQGEMKFRDIAKYQDVPTKTVQSRYRIGLDKLRILLNSKLSK